MIGKKITFIIKCSFLFWAVANFHILYRWTRLIQPPTVQLLPLKKIKEACNYRQSSTSALRDRKQSNSQIQGYIIIIYNEIIGIVFNKKVFDH